MQTELTQDQQREMGTEELVCVHDCLFAVSDALQEGTVTPKQAAHLLDELIFGIADTLGGLGKHQPYVPTDKMTPLPFSRKFATEWLDETLAESEAETAPRGAVYP